MVNELSSAVKTEETLSQKTEVKKEKKQKKLARNMSRTCTS